MSDLGGGELEHPRRWLSTQWPGLSLGVCRAAQSPPGAPRGGGAGGELGQCQRGTLTMLLHILLVRRHGRVIVAEAVEQPG